MEAANVSNDEDTEKWTPVFLRPCSYSIPPTSVYIGQLGNLNSEGELYKVLPDAGLYDVTPYAESSTYYRYAAPTHTKHDLILDAPSGDPGGEPSAGNREVFTGTQPGVLTLVLRAHLTGGASAEKIVDLVRFEVDDIPGSSKAWHTDNPNGRPTANGSEFTATVIFTTLPADNSSFGKKFARVLLDGQVVGSKCWWAFYTADAYNYPGAPTPPPDVEAPTQLHEAYYIPRNYYFYYKQTDAWYGSPGFYYPRSQETLPWQKAGPPYPYYVEVATCRTGYVVAFGNNLDNLYQYIDVFAYACRHEAKHGEDFDAWWSPCWDPAEDLDQDALPNEIEEQVGSNPYFSTFNNPGISNWTDDQWYTLNHELEWTAQEINEQDWAHPGAQFPSQN